MKPIALIDDDEDVRELIIFALENEGFKVIPYRDGREALKSLAQLSRENFPGFIIVDYLMPEMDGISFIKHLRKDFPETLGKIPLVLSSAMGQLEHDLQELGNIIHMEKPMELEDLLKQARHFCL